MILFKFAYIRYGALLMEKRRREDWAKRPGAQPTTIAWPDLNVRKTPPTFGAAIASSL